MKLHKHLTLGSDHPLLDERFKVEPGFASVTLGFHILEGNTHLIRVFENLHLIPAPQRERYSKLIDRHGKENLMRLIKQTKEELKEGAVYAFTISFTADYIENLWNVTSWQLWLSQSETSPPILLDRWVNDAYERVNLLDAQRPAPKATYPNLEKAMRHNPRIVVRTSMVEAYGKKQFLTLCANNCRLYIVDRYRVRVSDNFMWSIEKTDVTKLIAGLKRKDMRDIRLTWGLADTLEESQRICLEKADPVWEAVNRTMKVSAPKATTTGIKGS